MGIGLANYVEATGRGPFESAALRIGPSGKVVVTTGATAQGQGTQTMLAQLVRDVLGVRPDDITVIAGDTASSPLGLGAFASRQAVTAGNAIHLAAVAVREKAIRAAAELLEAAPDDLEVKDGAVQVKGVPQMRRSLGEIARVLGGVPGFALPGGMAPGLAAAIDFQPPALTYCNGTHVVEVEVDVETGAARSRTASARRCWSACATTRTGSRRPSPTATICCPRPTACRGSRSCTWRRRPRSIRSA
jgi:carbon-monoxide dehydrogenase large subunit